MYMTQALHRLLRQQPDMLAAVDATERMTWRDMADRVARIGGLLRSSGLQPGNRVAMLSRNSADFLAYILGTWWAGGVINPVNLRWTETEIASSLMDCNSRILIVEAGFTDMLPAIRAQAPCVEQVFVIGGSTGKDRDWRTAVASSAPVDDSLRRGQDMAAILYTGGTTGQPKGVMLSHDNLAASIFGSLAGVGGSAHEAYLHTAPLFHIGGLSGLFVALYSGSVHHFLPAFDPLGVLELLHRERIPELFLVPTMLRAVIDHPRFDEFDTGCVRRIRYGASPIDPALMDRALAAFPAARFHQAYGMTELSPVVTVLGEDDHGPEARVNGRLRSAGRPTATVDLRIVDPQDREVCVGDIGEIVVRGPTVMLGYWNLPEATKEVVRDGWMHTGDLGKMDADGYLTVVDRLKDMIITGGENVYSAEVEAVLSTHPDVAQVAVIALSDPKWGERVHAVIVPRLGAAPSPEMLIAHCRPGLAGYKIPRSFELIDALPLSGAAKVVKNVLRELAKKHMTD